MEHYFNQQIGVFKNALSNEWCDEVISTFERDTSSHRSRKTEEYTNDHVQDTFITLMNHKPLCDYFCNIFWNEIYPIYEYKYHLDYFQNVIFLDDFKVQKTQTSEGFHRWHSEYSHLTYNRLGVYTIYLNDIEEGGETEFLFQSLRVPPTKGTVCLFPAGYSHTHRGNPPLTSTKYIVTGWLSLYIDPEYDTQSINIIPFAEQMLNYYRNNE